MKIARKILGFIFILWIVVLLSNTKILLSEKKIESGEYYYVEGWDNVGDASQASLVCTYFNGRKIIKKVFWYAPNNFMGRDSCSFIIRD